MATIRTFNPNPHNMLELRRSLQALRIQVPPSSYDQTGPPGSTDDITKGWRIGSKWIDESADIIWQCADNTEGAAVWNRLVSVASTDGGVAGTPKGFTLATNASGDWIPLGVGADGQGLIADSAETLGIKWATIMRGAEFHITLFAADEVTFPTPVTATTTTTTDTGLLSVTTISADTTLTTSNTVVLCDATTGAITVTLPAASGNAGRLYHIKKIDSSANIVTVDANGSEEIDEGLTAVVANQFGDLTIVCDGSAWHVL